MYRSQSGQCSPTLAGLANPTPFVRPSTLGVLPADIGAAVSVVTGAVNTIGSTISKIFGGGGPTTCPVMTVDEAVRIIWPLRNNPAAAEKALDGCRKDARATSIQLMPQAWGIVNDAMAKGTVPSQVSGVTLPAFNIPLPSANTTALLLGAAALAGVVWFASRKKS